MFTLEQVVPWGRSFGEYCRMFALDDEDLGLRILGCGDGPASFNAEATHRGATVISCDPIYRCEAVQIRERIAVTYDQIFPLVTPAGERSPYVERCVAELRAAGHEATIETVPYEFQRGGNQMMRIRTGR